MRRSRPAERSGLLQLPLGQPLRGGAGRAYREAEERGHAEGEDEGKDGEGRWRERERDPAHVPGESPYIYDEPPQRIAQGRLIAYLGLVVPPQTPAIDSGDSLKFEYNTADSDRGRMRGRRRRVRW